MYFILKESYLRAHTVHTDTPLLGTCMHDDVSAYTKTHVHPCTDCIKRAVSIASCCHNCEMT